MMELILASASPRRQALLRELGIGFIAMPQDVDESPLPDEAPESLVKLLSLAKARAAMAGLSEGDHRPVLGSDTIVVCDQQILGKPENKSQGLAMLRLLANRKHQVMTAVALMNHDQEFQAMSITAVTFKPLSDSEIEAYWDSGEPADKAGAYALQGLGAMFVSEIHGSYSGVVGLPIFETVALLENFGLGSKAILQNQ